ncbi:MAG TPA: hypothetical protein VIN10_04040 [Bacteroidales bacterium]
MLKKIAHIILSFTLLVSTTGFTITRHYCGDIVESIAVDSLPESCCEMSDCCHNESTFYQVEDDFSIPLIDNQIQATSLELLFSAVFVVIPQIEVASEFTLFSAAESPPPLKTVTVLSLLQSYLC